MVNIMDPTPEQEQSWDEWVSELPRAVRETLQRYNLKPWKLYRLKDSGHRVTLYSVDEPEDDSPPTLRVDITGRFNMVAFDRRVFGVDPSDLEECDLPSETEAIGTLLNWTEWSQFWERAPKGDA